MLAIQMGPLLMAMIGLLTLASECRAFFYRPAAAVSVLSEYAALNDSSPHHTQVWKVVPEAGSDGAMTLRFLSEATAGTDAVCVLSLPSLGSAGEIVWKGIGKNGEKKSVTGLLLAPGFPAPCDVLPVGEKENGTVYNEKVEAGSRVFSKSYRVVSTGLSVSEAKKMGWIKGEAPGTSDLIMVTVTDVKGQRVVRQLWPSDGSWWLYEETPVRRSWLIY